MSSGTIAQVEINPGTLMLEADNQDQIFMDIVITNNNSESIKIYWKYEPGDNYPANWKTQICDLNLCYRWDDFESNARFPNVVQPEEKVVFTIKVKNNMNEDFPVSGNAYGILRLFDDPDRTNEIASTTNVISSTK